MKLHTILEAMPSSIIKHKQAMALKTPEKMLADFQEVSKNTGKSVKELALSAAWRHGYGKDSTKYWDVIKDIA